VSLVVLHLDNPKAFATACQHNGFAVDLVSAGTESSFSECVR
jgi:hypothetical protein